MKDWFKKNWLVLLANLMVIVGSAILIIMGFTVEEVSKNVILTDGIVIAVGALISYVVSKLKK